MEEDAQLIESCLAGDRDAFGRIVDRYRSLVCAIAYSSTGDVALSEDLAQETFLAAWRQLPGLRDWAKLRAWLAGIVRNLAKNAARRQQRRAEHAERLAERAAEATPTPLEQAADREQQAFVWSALADMPQAYREPLILFYREGQSIPRVADALDLSQDAVKQRLSRGRQMLRGQVAGLVEETLDRTAPTAAFTAAVLAALPAVGPQAAAATVAATAKGATAAKGALAGAVIGPLVGVLGAVIGIRASILNTRSPRERQFMVKMAWLAVGYVALFLAVLAGLIFGFRGACQEPGPGRQAVVWGIVAVSVAYVVGLLVLVVRTNRRQRQIQIEDGTYVEPSAMHPVSPDGKASKAAVYGSLAGGIFGSVTASVYHSCALRDDGSAACWGCNGYDYGQCAPQNVDLNYLDAGAVHTCGVNPDGTLECWGCGESDMGQCAPPVGQFDMVSAGSLHSCAISSGGSIECWGDLSDGLDQVPADGGGFTSVTAGNRHSCALASTGLLSCWGDNSEGQLDVTAAPYDQLGKSGDWHNCAIKDDGQVTCWGRNLAGESTAPASAFTQISPGNAHTCGILEDSSLECWGTNTHGQTNNP